MDRKPPRVTLLSATPSVVATGLPGETPERAAALPRPEEQGAGLPRLPHRRRQAAHRPPLPGRLEPDGGLGRPGEQRPAADRARAGGRLRVHGRRARPRRQLDRGAAAGAVAPRWRGRAPASRCAGSRCAARCPRSRPAPSRTSRSGRWTAASTGSCRASATPSRAPRRPRGRALPHPDPEQDQDRRLPRPRAGGEQRASVAARGGGAAAKSARGEARPLVVLPALTWQGLNRVDDDADGFDDRLPFAARGAARPPVRRRRPAAALRRGGVAAPALARPRAARPTTSPRTSRSPAARARPRERPGRGLRRQRALGAGAADGAPARLRRGRRPRGVFGADSFRRTIELSGDSARNPSQAAARERVRRADRAAAHQPGAAHRVRGRARAVRGHVELRRRVHRVRGLARPPAAAARRITAAGRDAGQPAFLALGLGGGIVLRAGTPQWARELEESALSLELPQVTKRIWRMLSAGGGAPVTRLPSCAP